MSTVVLGQNWLDQNRNEKVNNTLFERVADYNNSAIGALRTIQVGQRTAKLVDAISGGTSFPLKVIDHSLGVGVNALGLPRVISATADARDSLAALRKDDGVPPSRKIGRAFRDTMDTASAYSYATVFLTGNPALKNVATTTEFAADIADVKMSVSDYRKAAQLEPLATGDVKQALRHSKNYYLLRIVKAVISIALTIFGALMLAKGMTAIGLIALSLIGVLFAIKRDLYKEQGAYKVINFDRQVALA